MCWVLLGFDSRPVLVIFLCIRIEGMSLPLSHEPTELIADSQVPRVNLSSYGSLGRYRRPVPLGLGSRTVPCGTICVGGHGLTSPVGTWDKVRCSPHVLCKKNTSRKKLATLARMGGVTPTLNSTIFAIFFFKSEIIMELEIWRKDNIMDGKMNLIC